jgi:tRNA modification GTPase
MPPSTETIAALATPTGTSALAILRVSGPDTERLARELCGETPPPRAVRRADYRDGAGTVIDGVLATFFRGPHSYTGEDLLEVSCHGNPFVAQKILEDLFARGCRPAGPGEFTQRAFLNGRMDLSQAEAVMDVIHARSERALAAANQQLRGALGRRMESLVDALLNVLARVEAYIDFPEEDLPPEDRGTIAAELGRIILDTNRLLATNHYGELLREGIKTVIVGAPNVGKSSLLNRLVGRERALVSAEPGTTRDFIEEQLIVGPHCLRLIDTAGLNPLPAELERQGMAKTLERAEEADLFLLVVDATQPPPALPGTLLTVLRRRSALVVVNKTDLTDVVPTIPELAELQVVRGSALTGEGLEALTAAITAQADAIGQVNGNEIIAINARHANALEIAKSCLNDAQIKLAEHGPVELLASDLHEAMNALGEIAGKIDNERMLDRLFASFCIGK